MEFNNLIMLMKTMSESKLTDLQYEENGVKIVLSKSGNQSPVSGSEAIVEVCRKETDTADEAAVEIMDSKKTQQTSDGNIVTSPLVGVFYAAPAEDAAPFVAEGDRVEKGQTLAIVEAMKLMNEIECEYTGTVAEIYVENGQAVEYGQPLFRIV